MLVQAGYDIELFCAQPTFALLMMETHPEEPGVVSVEQDFPPGQPTIDMFGNRVTRLTLPQGVSHLRYNVVVRRDPEPEPALPDLGGTAPEDMPSDVLPWLTASRYCDSDSLAEFAWSTFGHIPPGSERVTAIFDYVHNHLTFGYKFASPFRTASDGLREAKGVCRDFSHLAVALCRAVNIPARYCNGYLGDIGIEASPAPMDFNAWSEVWLDGRWYTKDARFNARRIGRILIARGRDAADIPIINTFGHHELRGFKVVTDLFEG